MATTTTFPKGTINARRYAGQELHTAIIASRLDHVDVNGNGRWLLATPHGTFKTLAIRSAVDLGSYRGGAVLSLDGHGGVYGVDPIKRAGDPHQGYANYETWLIVAIIENTERYYRLARERGGDRLNSFLWVARDLIEHGDLEVSEIANANWDEVYAAYRSLAG